MSNTYENPLVTRYCSKDMSSIFSSDNKFTTWRKLWIALAKSQQELGLNITQEQIQELESNINHIDYQRVSELEMQTRHDVMSHVLAYGELCPKAKAIIHLGATSAFVGDNTDIIVYTQALKAIRQKILILLSKLSDFSLKYKDLPTLGFTHFQAAQLTTVGKRSCLWMMDLLLDLEDIDYRLSKARLRGVKGTTGTQASFLSLFNGDHDKVNQLDKMVCTKMGFEYSYAVTGQTYTRKYDYQIISILSGIAQSLHKMSNDIRLLQHLKEIEEPFEKGQIGSSAMAYKRNPMRSERISSLAKLIISLSSSPALVSATQWFERTLDDSANKRISIPEAFLAADAILNIAINISDGLVVYPKVIQKHIDSELPFMATENILMEAVKKGGDRQELHEKIRVYSMEAGKIIKEEGGENILLERIVSDPDFNLSEGELNNLLDAKNFIGRSSEQVVEFIEASIKPLINDVNKEFNVELRV
jgi:adenylosuccinate lyase